MSIKLQTIISLLTTLFLIGCGGGGGSDNTPAEVPTTDNTPAEKGKYSGQWLSLDTNEIINNADYFKDKSIKIIDNNQIDLTSKDGTLQHLIRAGISNVSISGEIAYLNDTKDTNSQSPQRGIRSIADMNIILENISSGEIKKYTIKDETTSHPAGTIESGVLFTKVDHKTQNLIIPETTELNMPTGNTKITVEDTNSNKASFVVEVVGEEVDMGVANLTQKEYNFKSSIINENDYIYFNDVNYSKQIQICNTGTKDISGVSFTITENNTSEFQSFSHNYDGSLVGFSSNTCKKYTVSFQPEKPTKNTTFKINIEVKDNFNGIIWKDYAPIRVSAYDSNKLYLQSNNHSLNGYLVAPGRQLIKVIFNNLSSNNFVRIPKDLNTEFQVILSAANILDEDVYMLSTTQKPNILKMNNFTQVNKNEPDNSEEDATVISMVGGEEVSYISQGDIDYYLVKDIPTISSFMPKNIFVDSNITLPMTTPLDTNSITQESVLVFDTFGDSVLGNISYDTKDQYLIFNPDKNMSIGKHTITLDSNLKTVSKNSSPFKLQRTLNVLDYPSSEPTVFRSVDIGYTLDVFISKNFAYIANTNNGLKIINISDPSEPTIVGSVDTGRAQGVSVIGNFAYVAANDGLKIINISDPSEPTIVGSVMDVGDVVGIATSGNFVYVDGNYGGGGLKIIDISNPSKPAIVGSVDTGRAQGVSVIGNFAYVAGSGGLKIIDISNPSKPAIVGSVDTGSAYGVTISGNFAYVAGSGGLKIIDISNPSKPAIVGSVDTGSAYGVTISGNFAYVANRGSGLKIIDISNPSKPVIVRSVANIGDAVSVSTSNNFAYIGSYGKGLKIINIQMYK